MAVTRFSLAQNIHKSIRVKAPCGKIGKNRPKDGEVRHPKDGKKIIKTHM
jgi:hypothetical protein